MIGHLSSYNRLRQSIWSQDIYLMKKNLCKRVYIYIQQDQHVKENPMVFNSNSTFNTLSKFINGIGKIKANASQNNLLYQRITSIRSHQLHVRNQYNVASSYILPMGKESIITLIYIYNCGDLSCHNFTSTGKQCFPPRNPFIQSHNQYQPKHCEINQ